MSSSNGELLGYIHDGQTRKGYISGVARLHPAVRFEYRPVLAAERDVIIQQVEEGDTRAATDVAASLVAKRVQRWDLKMQDDDEVSIVPLAPEHARRLQPSLLYKIYTTILGQRPADADPQHAPSHSDARQAARELEAALAGEPPRNEEAAQVGN